MSPSTPDPAHSRSEGPEPVPPAELLALREAVNRAPDDAVRSRHLAAITEALQTTGPPVGAMGQAIARRGARVVAGVAAVLVVTTGLAGAQVLPAPARAILPAFSQHLLPGNQSADQDRGTDEPPATDVVPETTTTRPLGGDPGAAAVAPSTTSSSTTEPPTTSSSTSSSTTSSSSTSTPRVTTAVPPTTVTTPTTVTPPTTTAPPSTTTSTTTPTTTSTTKPGSTISDPEEPDPEAGGGR